MVVAMNKAFEDANTENYQSHISKLSLPDPDDRHVLAAAIQAGARHLVTFNLKDFPKSQLKIYGIEPISPDDFLEQIIDKQPDVAYTAFDRQVSRLKNPPLTRDYVLDKLITCELPKTAAALRISSPGDVGYPTLP